MGRIFDSSRDSALVVVSPASDTQEPRIDTRMLAEKLAPGTELAVLDSMAASERLSDTVDRQFHCYGGSVRVVLAGAARTDHWRRHRLFQIFPGDDVERACRQIAQYVEDHQGAGAPVRVVAAPPGRGPRTAFDPGQEALLLGLKSQLEAAEPSPEPAASPRPEPTPPPAAPKPQQAGPPADTAAGAEPCPGGIGVDEMQRLLRSQADVIASLVHRRIQDDLLALVGNDQDAIARERSRADVAEEELDHLRRRMEEMKEREEQKSFPKISQDPERQLRWEIEYEWLTGTPEPEREGNNLRRYHLGQGFLKSLEADIVPRRKTIQVIVDVLTARCWDRRETHQFTEKSKSDVQRSRPDGSTAWRTYVKTGAPGAPRLIWWQLPDGAIELDHVGHHDDLLR
ncbi:MAG: hypothetical protein Q4B08_13890 [Propionibacteriaceae bacterium]|nr:hypothetical protein [Propionibacteriaceae bacterium]